MSRINIFEHRDRRYLGALRLVDSATGRPCPGPFTLVTDKPMAFMQNRSGLYVICSAKEFEKYIEEFDPAPSEPDDESIDFSLTISDPAGRYLTRMHTVSLPRPLSADDSDADADSKLIFEPLEVTMYASPSASFENGWCSVRATVKDPNDQLVYGALVTVTGKVGELKDKELGRGLTNEQGEALIVMPKVPAFTFEAPAAPDGDADADASVVTELSPVASKVSAVITAVGIPKRKLPVNPDELKPGSKDPQSPNDPNITEPGTEKILSSEPNAVLLQAGKSESVHLKLKDHS